MKRQLTGLAIVTLLAAPAAMAAVTTQAYGSMVVTGTIVVSPDGNVVSYSLDKPDRLPAPVVKDLAKVLPQWKFTPVMRDGKAVTARSHMSVRMLAEPIGGGKYAIMVGGARFGDCAPDTCVSEKHLEPPRYPRQLSGTQVAGTVYLVLQVGRDGTVQHVAAQQVDLRVRGVDWQMQRWREALRAASLRVAKHWTFNPPAKGPRVALDHWMVTVPVNFRRRLGYEPHYGDWHVYIPGPRNYVPWLGANRAIADALPPDGGLYPVQQSLHLLSSLRRPEGK